MPPAAYGAIMAGTAIYGAIQGSRRTSAEKAATNMNNTMTNIANRQHMIAEPALKKAMQYYMTLAGGNRGAIQSHLAPDIMGLNQSYKGAETRMMNTMAPGPTRDRQMAEMQREKAGAVGMMPFIARNQAIDKMANQGQQGMGNSLTFYNGAANQLPMMAGFDQQRSQNWSQVGSLIGNMLMPQLTGQQPWGNFLGIGAGTKNPSTPQAAPAPTDFESNYYR